jgi:hypothetical protein
VIGGKKKHNKSFSSNEKTTKSLKKDWTTLKRLKHNCSFCSSGCETVTVGRLKHRP